MSVLRRGTTTCWGIDLSTFRVDLGFVAKSGRWQTNGCLLRGAEDPADHGGKLVAPLERLPVFFAAMHRSFPAAVVYVERPTGAGRNERLVHTAGLIVASAALATGAPTYLISSTEWKKGIGLPTWGKADERGYPPLRWAQDLDPKIETTDEADCLGIATFAALQMWGAHPLPRPALEAA